MTRRLSPEQLAHALQKMASRLADGSVVEEVAREYAMSMAEFSKAFAQTVGASPLQWILERRIEQAKDLLREGSLTFADIAIACGFVDELHFQRVFLRATGLSPADWQRIRFQ
ncbi:helix-turn-helix transcriptional regulator [Sphingomonas sp. PR090111-T3T-6A]|uniref:helix-turn-helix transcriptional regulator n=1 Tax=Sphingomonas sp. PR090111-T3T-6A TaxID=685778 RepID=UPI0003AA5641|nr:AraC family transcriptional regulator [Sphingomonas sp. PR090111-T3T-6A]